ncbi:FkbM family methyltransferase, partial [Candidatus Binatia bacterium]|nr:FkbM family methyltransferase [Candidatus Binatia bacterium]
AERAGWRAPDDARVTHADVTAAYRLFLNREPDPDGWRNFSAMVGKADVTELATCFVSSEEFRRSPVYAGIARTEHSELTVLPVASGMRLAVSPHDVLYLPLLESGQYEVHVAAALDETLRLGMTVCCVGANIGYHALRAARSVGSTGKVVAFEARPATADLLRRNALLNGLGNVVVLPLAVADRFATYEYVLAQGTNGYIRPVSGEGAELAPEATAIQAVPLDALANVLSPLDVLQMDVEGAEGLVVNGALDLLRAHRPRIFSELCLGQLERTSSMSGEDLLGILAALSYRFTALGFDGARFSFGAEVAAVLRHARSQPTSHIDLLCEPG